MYGQAHHMATGISSEPAPAGRDLYGGGLSGPRRARSGHGARTNGLALNVRTRTKSDIYHHVHRASPGHHMTRVSPRPPKQGHWGQDTLARHEIIRP
jgi:hypothetical protein